jgi:predicted DNA-binding protein (MmcQ/YjbR family)
MNFEDIRIYCLGKKAVSESCPFDDVTLVFKVAGKIFALMSLDSEVPELNLKCDPEKAIEVRERYPCVKPGYHMNKKMWNTVVVDGSVNDKQLHDWIDHSYSEVVKGLPKKTKAELELQP